MRRALGCMVGVVVIGCGRGERRAAPTDSVQATVSPYAKGTEMAKLADAFDSAKTPSDPDLTGVWAEIRSVQTMQLMEGHDGPDKVQFDSTGIRADAAPDAPLS